MGRGSVVVALLIAGPAAAKPRRPAPQVVAPPPPLAPPTRPAEAQPAGFAVPTPTGPEAQLEIVGLTRDWKRFRIEGDFLPLTGLEASTIDALFGQLAADPRWRVTLDHGQPVAWRRDDDFVIGPGGWDLDRAHCRRAGIRSAGAIDATWAASTQVARVAATTTVIDTTGFRADGGLCDGHAVAVRIEGDVVLEVFEAGDDDSRPAVTRLIEEGTVALANLRYGAPTIAADGFDALTMPDAEPLSITAPALTVSAGGPGWLLVRARANPGEPGVTWVRLLGADSRPVDEAAIGAASLERCGWSRDPTQGFYLQSTVPAPATLTSAALWFQAEGGEPRLLVEASAHLP